MSASKEMTTKQAFLLKSKNNRYALIAEGNSRKRAQLKDIDQ